MPPPAGQIVVLRLRRALRRGGGVEGGSVVAQFHDDGAAGVFDDDLELLARVARQRVVDDVAAAFRYLVGARELNWRFSPLRPRIC